MAANCDRRMLIIAVGLPGSGKTTLCRAAAEYCKGVVLNKDLVRAALFEPGHVSYTAAQDDLVQELLLRAAEWLLQENPQLRVFLDGRTFSRSYQIQNAIQAAEKMGTAWRVVECVCKPETAIRRIENDVTHPAKNRDAHLYQRLKETFEPVTVPKIVIDTDKPVLECISHLIYSL